MVLGLNTQFLLYFFVFGVAAVACLIAAKKTEAIKDSETRRGLFYLLVSSAIWSMAHIGYLLSPNQISAILFYQLGLVFGLVAVGAWLYFCSAYTHRTYHKNSTYRWIAVFVFLALLAVKWTNSLHSSYFSIELVNSPFMHYAIENKIIHWVFMGLSYSLSLIGYFMLLERFNKVSGGKKPLLVLVTITALPLVFDLIGYSTPYLIDITYEPIGVAIFGIGVLYLYLGSFQAIQLGGSYIKPVLVLDEDRRIKEFNERADSIFPTLSDEALGRDLEEFLPDLSKVLESEEPILEIKEDRKRRFYQVTESPFSAHQSQLGSLIVLKDITEKKKSEEREEILHSLLRHDVQNKNQVIEGYLSLLKEKELVPEADEMINKALTATYESQDIIEKVRTLRELKKVEIKPMDLKKVIEEVSEKKYSETNEKDIELDLKDLSNCGKALAGSLLKEVFGNLIENAIKHSEGNKIRIRCEEVNKRVFVRVDDDGIGIPDDKKEKIFDRGIKSDKTGGTGLGLYLVREIINEYGGEIKVEDSDLGGASFRLAFKKPKAN